MHDTDWVSGNIYIRPRNLERGQTVRGHLHNFDHTHFTISGWILVRGWVNGQEVVVQKCAPEYRRTRALLQKHEPHALLRPIRLADAVGEDGWREFRTTFIGQGDPVPEGGTEIEFNPTGYHVLVRAGTPHDAVALDTAHGLCVYSHREPQGDVTQAQTGWDEAYR